MSGLTDRLEAMLNAGQDNLLLRFGLGKAYAEAQNYQLAIEHLTHAVQWDPNHSSSWFWLGRATLDAGDLTKAAQHLHQAVSIAEKNGDQQTIKMAQVFLARITKRQAE